MIATKTKGRIRDFTEGPILSRILMFALPLIATSILQLLFNTADIVVVGRFGGSTPEECAISLAAVGSCSSLISLLVNLFMGLAVGTGICVAHDMGAKDYKGLSQVVHTAVIAATVCGAFVGVLGFIMAPTFLTWMGTDEDVLFQATRYMRAYFCGVPAGMLYNYCAAMLRSTGDTVRPLTFLSISGVANVLLNLVMVLVFHSGAMGVGIATAASQWISCVLILLYMLRTDGPCHLSLDQLRVTPEKLRKIVRLGIPAGIQGSLFAISNVLIQSSINSLGEIMVAGHTAAANLEGYIYTAQNALYQATLTFVGQNVGAKKYERLKKCIFYCLGAVTVIGLVMSVGVYVFGRPLLRIYAPDSEAVIEAGMISLGIAGLTHFLCGMMEVGCGIMRGFGKSLLPMFTSLIGSCALRVIWVYTAFAIWPTAEVLYVSYPVTWTVTAAAHFIFAFITYKKFVKQEKNALAARPEP